MFGASSARFAAGWPTLGSLNGSNTPPLSRTAAAFESSASYLHEHSGHCARVLAIQGGKERCASLISDTVRPPLRVPLGAVLPAVRRTSARGRDGSQQPGVMPPR